MADYVWHFREDLKCLRDGTRLRHRRWLPEVADPVICERGYHASRRPLDALAYAPGPIVSLCKVRGITEEKDDKLVAKARLHLWSYDAAGVLCAFARQCALDVAHLWEMPDVVRRYLESGDESIRADASGAASAAAWYAASAAASDAASVAASAAARYAASAAASAAARYAARADASAAARYAARDAASAAASDAASVAASDAQNTRLHDMLMDGKP